MDKALRAIPVLYACRGCERDGPARAVARLLDQRGLGEAYLAGAEADRARARFPIYVIEGCEKACASAWLAGIGVQPLERFFLGPAREAAAEAERIAARWRAT
ncbi:MAG TPA: putative zinc-binding protein [Burkholderiales bacterium]